MKEDIIEYFNAMDGKTLEINLIGFISGKFYIENAEYHIENDVLNLKDKKTGVFIEINLNQTYQEEKEKNELTLYMDNDLVVKIAIQ